ncbi:biliverdin-producing heme oxygenase [Bosea sp. (in: a-proteobacteria)]|uniref:biliverdin-producing heme oxygenase n=1 Tax=Bosea sp. (in: a-proteobacteria) TaxID=1871050 RepID=UPI003B3A374A
MDGLRGFLRVETRDLHERLDGIIGTFASMADYDRFLIGSFRHRLPVEQALAGLVRTVSVRRMEPELRRDLADRELSEPATERLVLSNDMASALGATYVLEGSALGARVLVKSAAALGMSASHGAHYLSAQAASMAAWRELLALLDQVDASSWERAAGAARAVFDHAIQAFSSRELPAA